MRSVLEKTIGILAGALLACALAEAAIRVLDLPPRPLPGLDVLAFRLSTNPILRYEFVPDYEARPGSGAIAGFRTNADGFRDHDYPLAKPTGVTRLVVLGDSIVAGKGIAEIDKMFPKILERRLNERQPSPSYEVLNLGVGGYNTLQQAELLRTRGLAYQPDAVLVGFCLNDFSWHADGRVYERLLKQLDASDTSPRSRSELIGSVLNRSRLFLFAYERLGTLLADGKRSIASEDRRIEGHDPVEMGFELLAALQREHGVPVYLFIVPAFDRPFSAYRHGALHERVRKLAARFPELQLVDLLDDFRASGASAGRLAADDVHPNERGHALLAELVHRRLEGGV